MGGHGSHCTAQFDKICNENSIIAIYMPSHSSHLLQPLDVCCFGPLKQAYGDQIRHMSQQGIGHIDKLDFLAAYIKAHTTGFSQDIIKKGFLATGINPFNPEIVY